MHVFEPKVHPNLSFICFLFLENDKKDIFCGILWVTAPLDGAGGGYTNLKSKNGNEKRQDRERKKRKDRGGRGT